MKTNDLKKGMRIRLRNGWEADVWDNMRGNTRVCNVYGDYTEAGSVYSHDIMYVFVDASTGEPLLNVPAPTGEGWLVGSWAQVEHTPAQLKCKAYSEQLFGG